MALTAAEKRKRDLQLQKSLDDLHAKRVAKGRCRHCGGPVPCWSYFGDEAVGIRRDDAVARIVRGGLGKRKDP